MRHSSLAACLSAFVLLGSVFPAASEESGQPQPDLTAPIILGDQTDDFCCELGDPFGALSDLSLLQSTDPEPESEPDPEPRGGDRAYTGLATRTTDRFVADLVDIDQTCNDMRAVRGQEIDDDLYRIDCYRVLYLRLGNAMPKTGDYAPIRQALLDSARKLDRIVRAYEDKDAPEVRVRERAQPAAAATPPLRAIRKDKLRTARSEAAAVLKETSIVILRAGEIPTRRTAHYAKVAAAVEGNMAVLRSA